MKKNYKRKKSSKEKRVLLLSMACAVTLVAGSTFAWFTSKDEVTNRLSATANYGVTIAEDFTPPENWVPGQKVDKNVGVVNTGNVDAFVRTWLEGEMRLLAQSTSALGTATVPDTNSVTDAKLIDLGFTYSNGTGSNLVYLKELDNTKLINNPTTQTQNASSPDAYTEVMSVQVGGELAYVADDSSYKFTPNETLNIFSANGVQIKLVKGTEYEVTVDSTAVIAGGDNMALSGTTLTLHNLADFRTIDSNTFKPVSDGLYIFKRNTDLGTTDDFEFSGYYVKTISATQHFFALEYDNSGSQRSDYVLSDTAITNTIAGNGSYTVNVGNVKLFTAKQETIENSALTWTLVKGITKNGVTYTTTNNGTTWKKGETELTPAEVSAASLAIADAVDMFQVKRTAGAGSKVLVDIALANLGNTAEMWTAITDTDKTTTFYYNNDLEEGATTSKLVDSMTMDSTVTQNDYIAFDFDLNVKMDSIQVTVDENGAEGFTTVNPWSVAATATYSDATGATGTVTDGEIELIAWS